MSQPNGRSPHEDRSDIEALKAGVDLAEVVAQSGVSLRKVGRNLAGLCPFHEDGDASLVVNPETQLWKCFGCQSGGDVLSFFQLREGLDFRQALERLRAWSSAPHSRPARSKNGKSRLVEAATALCDGQAPALPGGFSRGELLARVSDFYTNRLRASDEARDYLVGRGLGSAELWKAFGVGFCDGSLLSTLPESGELRQALSLLGVINSRGREHFYGCVVVALEHPDRGVVGLYGRRMSPRAQVKHLFLPGPQQGVLNWQSLKLSRQVVVAESVLDALSVWMAGCRDVTCLFGVQGLPRDLEELLGRFGIQEVRLCLDADAAGREATQRLAARLQERGVRCQQVVLPEGKDPNQVLVEDGAEALRDMLGKFTPIEPPPPSPSPQTPGPDDCNEDLSPHKERTGDGFVVRFSELTYRVTPRPPFSGRLRVTLRVSKDDKFFVETVDLYSHRTRAAAVNQLHRQLGVAKEAIERQFLTLIEDSEAWVLSVSGQEEEESALGVRKPPEMTAAEKEEAIAFLRRTDLVSAILEDTDALGYVGEEQGKLLAYLIGVSRKLERPLSGIVLSQSGAGKSSLAELVESLTPPEHVVLYSRISAQALGYLPRDFLKRKLLILEERVGAEAADYQIRVLQSRQRLSQAVVVKDPSSGKMHTRHFEVEGPIAYLETTTNSRIHHENATRCFEIHLDESEEQTGRIHQRQRESRMEGTVYRQAAEAIRHRHHNAQRLLEPVRIFIPYVSLLSFPKRWLRTRRDHERFLSLVDASAFLHQHQREGGTTEEEGKSVRFIRASLEDYRLAYSLANEVLRSTLHELTRGAQELWGILREMVCEQSQGRDIYEVCFTRRDVRSYSGWPDRKVRDALQELVEMEYIGALSGSQGRTYQYRLLTFSETTPSVLGELTSPEELERLLAGGGAQAPSML